MGYLIFTKTYCLCNDISALQNALKIKLEKFLSQRMPFWGNWPLGYIEIPFCTLIILMLLTVLEIQLRKEKKQNSKKLIPVSLG